MLDLQQLLQLLQVQEPQAVLLAIADTTGTYSTISGISGTLSPIYYTGFANSHTPTQCPSYNDTYGGGQTTHFDALGLAMLGNRYWSAYASALANAPPVAPTFTGATISLGTLTSTGYPISITFNGVSGNPTTYSYTRILNGSD